MLTSRNAFLLLASIILIIPFLGCPDNNNESPVAPVKEDPPSFSVASINVECPYDYGTPDCIIFHAKSEDKDVVLVKVEIAPPVGESFTISLNNYMLIEGEGIDLATNEYPFPRISGEWEFVFIGNLATGDKSSFEVTVTVDVSA
ncbi:hypothetical protein JXA70_05245 [candidate division KSB1 bacterium]|nr:hypothetical protein [candidate division KSB1 bacterium]